VVAAKDDINVKGLKEQRKWDVVKPDWIVRCMKSSQLLQFRPEELMVNIFYYLSKRAS